MICTQCGSPLEPGAKFCGSCGAVVPDDPATEVAPPMLEDMPTEFVPEPSLSVIKWILRREGEDPFLLGERVLLGRSSDCDIKLEDTEASREHAVLEKVGEGYTLTDQGSTNGTFVNEERSAGSVVLKDDDTIRIGSTIFTVSVTDGEPTMSVCPSCGADISKEMTFCGSCGHTLSAVSAAVQPSPMAPGSAPAPPVQDTPVSAAAPQEDLEEMPPPTFKIPRRGLLIGCGVILLLGIVTACCVSTVGSGLLDWLLDLLYEIQYMF